MKNKIVFIGAGGHACVCAEIAELNGYSEIVYLSDAQMELVNIEGKSSDYVRYLEDSDFFVAIGNNGARNAFQREIESAGGSIATLIHPNNVVSSKAQIGKGCVVMAGAIINPRVRIGDGVIVNTGCSVDHDCVVDDFVHVGVGTHLAGTVSVGAQSFVGAGAIVINNISVCEKTVIGAGATVIRDIVEPGTYVGVPAHKK